ncbi:MAG TPA: translation initiation factor IF-3 [Gammaproteobacteria bacterium]|nr:translation initiation factor IF-3 [Gammaproteobacteria bacterium]HAE04947.1 translation initiation factor IF-3 [Gammaproteobacteria bacterium]HAE70939.1 translation initiation factor IF-3 [Gammaproteobacteria bacterium]HAG47307.1 translation initiation factor IF-3 [Gammaproteobacteria bacterium]HAN33595.1 translation initiation factor IF-3 [Gammaproteobacteria bacterium]
MKKPYKVKTRINDNIRVSEVRLIDANGDQAGVVSTSKAKEMAKDSGMDLVEVSPNAEPPVCKIMDFGKFLYEQKKQLSDQKRKQKKNTVKTIKYRPGTEEGDYQIKFRNLVKFLDNGDKVKVSIWFRGREMQHRELGMEMLDRIEKDTEEFANVEQKAKMEGRQLGMMLAPKSKKK